MLFRPADHDDASFALVLFTVAEATASFLPLTDDFFFGAAFKKIKV